MSTRRELTPRRKTRSPPVRSWRHSNSRNSISTRFSELLIFTNRTASYLELIEPEGIDHVDDVEKEVSRQAGQNQGLSGESARIGKESLNACRRNTDFWLKIPPKKVKKSMRGLCQATVAAERHEHRQQRHCVLSHIWQAT